MTIEEHYNRAKDNFNGRAIRPPTNAKVSFGCLQWRTKHLDRGEVSSVMKWGLAKVRNWLLRCLETPKRVLSSSYPRALLRSGQMRLGSLLRNFPSTSLMDQRDTSKRRTSSSHPYSLLSTPEDTPIHTHTWDRVILDEAHEIRNKSSRLFKSVCRLKTDIKWIVTGTPVFNSMNDFCVSLCLPWYWEVTRSRYDE